jgi:hypothetical protein
MIGTREILEMAATSLSAGADDNKFDLGSQLAACANIFIDPAAAVKRMVGKWPWLVPFLIVCAVTMVASILVSPIRLHVMQMNPPENMAPDQWERSMAMAATFTKIANFAIPVIVLVILLISAGLMTLLSNMMDVKTKFKNIFTLLAYCGLISVLHLIASTIVVLAKGDQIQSMQQLQPPFGLDLILTETSKPVWAILNFFSIFMIWYLVILVFAYSYMTGASRSKAILAITPVWVIPLMFTVLGAMFQR